MIYALHTAVVSEVNVCLSFLQGRSVVRVCESLSKLHEYVSPSELKLPSSTVSLEEDLKASRS